MTIESKPSRLFRFLGREGRASRRARSRQAVRHRFLSQVEFLEDRVTPSLLTVTSLADSGTGSLRSAIQASVGRSGFDNGSGTVVASGNDTIQFSPAIDGGTVRVTSFLNDLTANSTMAGPTAFLINNSDQLIIDGSTGLAKGITIARNSTTPFRLFQVAGTGDLTLKGLTLSGGLARGADGANGAGGGGGGGGMGGAVFNQGKLTLLDSTLTGNTARGGDGGYSTAPNYSNSGGGGGGIGGSNPSTAGGGPNGGGAGTHNSIDGGVGGIGGGGGGGYGGFKTNSGSFGLSNNVPLYGNGGVGGFGGGGGGGAYGRISDGTRGMGVGGNGGFGGGGGGGGIVANNGGGAIFDNQAPWSSLLFYYGISAYGGGRGAGGRRDLSSTSALIKGGGGAGAGMGGAIFNERGTVVITNSTIAGNAADGGDGGRGNPTSASRYNGDPGKGLGGGLFNHNGSITVANSTFSQNVSNEGGRGVFNLGDAATTTAKATISNTIIGQSDTGYYVSNLLGQQSLVTVEDFTSKGNAATSGGGNLIRTSSGFAGTIVSTADPKLGPLQDNGGPTPTMAPAGDSPVVDKGVAGGAPPRDQRGVARSTLADIGAYEVRLFARMVVNTAADSINAGDNKLSLREAMGLANGTIQTSQLSASEQAQVAASAGITNTITFDPGLNGSTLTLSTVGDTSVGASAFAVNNAINLVGPGGSSGVTLSAAGGSMRFFNVAALGSLTLTNLTLRDGTARGIDGNTFGTSIDGRTGLGGAVYNQGSLTILGSTLASNTARGGSGVTSEFVAGAGGDGMGGAVYNAAGNVAITSSTFANNTAIGGIGGASSSSIGRYGSGWGGGLFSRNGSVRITNSTFSANAAAQGGRGLSLLGDGGAASAAINNTIIGQADTNVPDLSAVASNGGTVAVAGASNLIRTIAGATGLTGTLTGDPLLGPLQANGGPTPTMALAGNSPAIGAGNAGLAPATDQRGNGRAGGVDLGAYEYLGQAITFGPLNPTRIGAPPIQLVATSTSGGPVTFSIVSGPGTISGSTLTTTGIGTIVVQADQAGYGYYAPAPPVQQTLVVQDNVIYVSNTLGSGTNSLRWAVDQANATPGPDVIAFDKNVFATMQVITLIGGQLALTDTRAPITIVAPTAGVTISGGGSSRVFQVYAGVNATFSRLTITGGRTNNSSTPVGGAGIYNAGTLTLDACMITGNNGTSGGGVFNSGTLVATGSTVSSNTGVQGGGLYNADFATLTLTNSTITANSATASGGGIAGTGTWTLTGVSVSGNSSGSIGGGIASFGTATLLNSTISGNRSSQGGGLSIGGSATLIDTTIDGNAATYSGGGGLDVGGAMMVTLTNSTITANSSTRNGGGLQTRNPVTLANTIVAGNTSVGYGPDIFTSSGGSIASQGFNLIGKTDGSGGWVATDLTGTAAKPLNAMLGPLANNGGPTLTRAPLAGSPVINAGNNAAIPAGVTTDQRGRARIVNTTVDIGALEINPATITSIVRATPSPATTNAGSVAYTVRFATAISGLTAANFDLGGTAGVGDGNIGTPTTADGGLTWTVPVGGLAGTNGTLGLSLVSNVGLDHDVLNLPFAGEAYTLDHAGPTATISVAGAALTVGETSPVTITFSEAVVGFTNDDLTAPNGTLSAVASSDGGRTWTATFTPTPNVIAATNVITLNLGGVQDLIGNAGSGTVASSNYSLDTRPATAVASIARTTPTTQSARGGSVTYTVRLTQASLGLSAANFDLTGTAGIADSNIGTPATADGGLTWSVTVGGLGGGIAGSLTLNLVNSAGLDHAPTNLPFAGEAYQVDTRPDMSIQSIARTTPSAMLTNSNSVLYTVTFADAILGLTSRNFSLTSLARDYIGTPTTADGGRTWSVVVGGLSDVRLGTIGLNLVNDVGLNYHLTNLPFTGETYYVDQVAPTATISVADAALTVGETSPVTITFSEAVVGFTNDDLTAPNGTLSAVASSDGGRTWTATFTPTPNVIAATNVITLATGGVQDMAGNRGIAATSNNYAINTQAGLGTVMVTVTNQTDVVNGTTTSIAALIANPGADGISLREAVTAANNTLGPAAITFDPTAFAGPSTITLAAVQLELSTLWGVSIAGPAAGVTIRSGGTTRVLQVDTGVTASFSKLTITGGSVAAGGGLLNNGTATLTDCIVIGNTSTGNNSGGGISNAGTLTLIRNKVTGNTSGGSGGGIFSPGTLTLIDSTVSGNSTVVNGGGIGGRGDWTVTGSTVSGNSSGGNGGGFNVGGGTLTLSNSTVSGNSGAIGGGISGTGKLVLTNSTVSGNSASVSGGGLRISGSATLSNTIIAGNSAPAGPDVQSGFVSFASPVSNGGNYSSAPTVTFSGGGGSGAAGHANVTNGSVSSIVIDNSGSGYTSPPTITLSGGGGSGAAFTANISIITSLGNNLIGKTDGSPFPWVGSDRTGTIAAPLDPRLAPLADNGGPTKTMALLADSPAIDAGNNSLIPAGVGTDQRGSARIGNGIVDIGAYESEPRTIATTAALATSAGTTTYGQSLTFTVTVSASSTPVGRMSFVIDSGTPVAAVAGVTTGTTATWTFMTSALAAGTHTVRAVFVGDPGFSDTDATLSGGQVVTKADATMVVGGFTGGTYDGVTHAQTVTVTGVGGDGVLKTSSLIGTDAGSYSQPWSFTNPNYNDLAGTLAFLIAKADARVAVNGYTGTYDGSTHGASGTATGVGGVDLSGSLGLGSSFTNATGGTARWTFSGGTNYNDQSGDVAISIAKANATAVVSGTTGSTYDGTVQAQTVTVTGNAADGVLYSTSLAGTAAGSYSQPWSLTNPNYNDLAGTLAFLIAKATSTTTTVGAGPFTYDGTSQAGGSGTVMGVGLNTAATSLTYSGDLINAGTYRVTAHYAGDDNHLPSDGQAVAITISKADSRTVLTIVGGPFAYNGRAQTPATVATTGAGGLNLISPATYLNNLNAGTATASFAFAGDANHNPSGDSKAFTIGKADATVVIGGYTGGTYDGTAHAQSVAVTGSGIDGLLYSASLIGTDAGSYAQPWSYTNPNYNDLGGSLAFAIAKANATIAVKPYTVTYDGTAHTATVTAITGVNGEAGPAVGRVDLGGTMHTNAGTYSDTWSFAGTANYNAIVGTPITNVINKAALTITAQDDIKTYGTQKIFGTGNFTQAGLIAGDAVSGVTLSSVGGAAGAAAGTYAIIPGAATGTGLGNYAITYVNGALTVLPALTVPAAQSAYEDVEKVIGGISIGAASTGNLTLTLNVGHGTLQLWTTTGLTISGNGTGSVSLTGAADRINTALKTLVYRGMLDYSGDDTLSLSIGESRASVAIRVESAADQAADLQEQVSNLQKTGVLNKGQANMLAKDLNLKGNSGDIVKVLQFLSDVTGLLCTRVLTPAQADSLLSGGMILFISVTRRSRA